MPRPKPVTEPVAPVDAEDNDRRRAEAERVGRLDPLQRLSLTADPVLRGPNLNPAADTEPQQASAQQDEHRGLAARILDLRKLVELNRVLHVKEYAQQQQRIAQLEQLVTAMATRLDTEVAAIQQMQRDLQATLHDGGEQVRKTGELARKIQAGMQELEELRATASDPHEVVKPLLRSIATLRGDLEALAKTIDIRFEQMPKSRAQVYETRGDDEDPITKLTEQVRTLSQRLRAVEAAN